MDEFYDIVDSIFDSFVYDINIMFCVMYSFEYDFEILVYQGFNQTYLTLSRETCIAKFHSRTLLRQCLQDVYLNFTQCNTQLISGNIN